MTQNNIAQKFNDAFEKVLKSQRFNPPVTSSWLKFAQEALMHASPLSLGVTAKEFNDLVGIEADEISLHQFAILNNNLEKTSASQLNLPLVVYCNVINVSNQLAEKWNEITKPMRDEIMASIVKEDQGIPRDAKVKEFPIRAKA